MIHSVSEGHDEQLPTLWLLGKTAAGKSSLIQAITGNTQVEIGNGFKPCTMTSSAYDFPEKAPLLRFLDSRGLAESGYDPQEDIQVCAQQGHALIVVMKVDEPEQSAVLQALKSIKSTRRIQQLLVVHTGLYLLESEKDRERSVLYQQEQVEKVWGGVLESVAVDFELDNGGSFGIDTLTSRLVELLPVVARCVDKQRHLNLEEQTFQQVKSGVIKYATSASAADVIPVVGLISVPGIQAKMLHSLASQYGVQWNKQVMAEFAGTLGAGFGVQYLSSLGRRQLLKLLPGYGQVIGAASAAAISYSTTYAIGRVACKYFYHKSKDEQISDEAMQALFESVFIHTSQTKNNK